MDVAELRRAKDDFFRRSAASPLTPEQRRVFAGLRYFDTDPAFHFEVVLEPDPTGGFEDVQMSDGGLEALARAGTVGFTLGGADQRLRAFAQGADLFITFRDATSGAETYGAGRYVEAHALGGGRWDLDFNAAYNPYCAYNENWRCPLPPTENWLGVPVRAGERAFAH